MNPKDAKVLILATANPENPKQCPAPFLFAQEAVKLGSKVTICFVAEAPLMLKQGVAEKVYPKPNERPLSGLIAETIGNTVFGFLVIFYIRRRHQRMMNIKG